MSFKNDEIVDRVLHGLRDTAPPEGMESRAVSALRHRASATPSASRTRWRTASAAGGVALAGVVCALFFIAHRKTPQAASPRAQTVSSRLGNGLATPLIAATRKQPKQAFHSSQLALAASPKKQGLAAVSYPAPPMPLTKQEKLLVRLAHKGDPVQLAMLDPVGREASYAEERAQVQKFFTPPKQEMTSEP